MLRFGDFSDDNMQTDKTDCFTPAVLYIYTMHKRDVHMQLHTMQYAA